MRKLHLIASAKKSALKQPNCSDRSPITHGTANIFLFFLFFANEIGKSEADHELVLQQCGKVGSDCKYWPFQVR